jgi:hypothetical protein
LRSLAAVCLLAVLAVPALAQTEGELTAKNRVFPSVGPGLRAIKKGADNRVYVLQSPSPGVIVFGEGAKAVLQVGAGLAASSTTKLRPANIVFGEDCDVDADGRIYVADRGANQVLVFSPEGSLQRSIPVPAPVSVAALPDGEVAVATLREPHLVIVFDKNGRDVREFGDPEPLSELLELNRSLSVGRLATDGHGHLYYGFDYLPEPTVRQYDRYGYAGQDIQFTNLDAFPEAQAMRREIVRQEKKTGTPSFKRVLTAVGVDHDNGDVWIGLHNMLLHFDKDGNRRASFFLHTPEGARLEAMTILVDKDRLIIGADPLGFYEFAKPKSPFTSPEL